MKIQVILESEKNRFTRRPIYVLDHILLDSSFFFFLKIVPFMINLKNYCRVRKATHSNMVHAHCKLEA